MNQLTFQSALLLTMEISLSLNTKLIKARRLAKPPMPESTKLCNQVLAYLQSNPHGSFPQFNRSQISAIAASLTRRLTLIQGPPGKYISLYLWIKNVIYLN